MIIINRFNLIQFKALLGFIVLGMLCASTPASAGLIVNGDFETGFFTGWTLDGPSDQNFVDGGFSHSGDYSAYLSGYTDRAGSLSQFISTTPGDSYTLSFWFAGTGDASSRFNVYADDRLLLSLSPTSLDLDYQEYHLNFTAISSSTSIKFNFIDNANYLLLDDVDVVPAVAVPEPTSRILMGTSLLALATYTWHRRWRSAR